MIKRKRNFRWARWIFFSMLSAAAIVVVVLVAQNYFVKKDDSPQQNTSVNKTEDKKTEIKTDDIKEGPDNENENEEQKDKVPQYEGDNPNRSETLTGLITYADVIDDDLVIRVNIDQFLQSGSCDLTISRNGATYYTQSVPIVASVSTSTCDGYKIAASGFSGGDFSIEIGLRSGDKSGKITGKVKI